MFLRLLGKAAGVTAAGTALAVALGVTPALAAPPAPRHQPQPLERLFDNRAVSHDDHRTHADFDQAGNSLSAGDLRAAGWHPGARVDLDAASLTWPRSRPGTPDNVRADGQRVRLSGRGDAVNLLAAATSPGRAGGQVTASGRVHYRDGGSSPYRVTVGDWRGGPLSTKAVALPHVNTANGRLTEKARLYPVTVPVLPGREVESLELPADPGPDSDLHVFAAALRDGNEGWTGTWSSSTAGYTGVGLWRDQTLRMVVHSSVGGSRSRIRLENTFASGPVRIGAASLAVQAHGAESSGRPVPLRFRGQRGAVIPAGAQLVSDPVGFTVPEDSNLLVSVHLPGPVYAAPVHSATQQSSFLSEGGSGDRTGDRQGGSFTRTLRMWPFLTGVDVRGGPGSVVALGDSITDGVGSTEDQNRRWPNVLARRLLQQREVPRYGVLNHGISANRVVTDRYPGDGISLDTGGVSAGHRLDRDVLGQAGVRTVVLFEGINDVRAGTSAPEVVAGMREVARRARAHGLRVLGATIAPCEGYKDCTPEVEERRQGVNAFLRDHGGVFDAVWDFDAVLRDPDRPQRMLPGYDSGDHLHPSDDGLRALGDSVDLASLVPRR
ncbi:SGNH/GDSL hydrolase family protein [Streptomyces sp. NPDC005438]|uniref:SGNH/GDSL hydrolase family protein n=1 Tax=Streptomyces sp. NPDC005438 TaxID=3156880 RepID=UPI0033B4AC6D